MRHLLIRVLPALWAAAVLLIAGFPAAGDQDVEPLQITCSIQPKKLSRREEGRVVLKLDIKEGLRISAQPSPVIEFEPLHEAVFPKNFFTASDLGMAVIEENGERFLDLARPVEIPFTVSPDAKRGGYILEGRIKYFVKSPKEGWCYKTTSKFSAAFTTRAAVVKKD
jgi:hypothetical protein